MLALTTKRQLILQISKFLQDTLVKSPVGEVFRIYWDLLPMIHLHNFFCATGLSGKECSVILRGDNGIQGISQTYFGCKYNFLKYSYISSQIETAVLLELGKLQYQDSWIYSKGTLHIILQMMHASVSFILTEVNHLYIPCIQWIFQHDIK